MSSSAEAKKPELPSYRILLIEDNPDDAFLLQKLIHRIRAGRFEVEHVSRLRPGISRLEAGGIDLVMLDLTLPDSQGLDTYRAIHKEMPEVPIIVISGIEDESIANRTVSEGAQDYLVKGQADSTLIEHAIRYAIHRAKAEAAFSFERDLLHALMDGVPDRIYFKDTQSRFIRMNRAVSQLFHFTDPSQVIGKSDFDLFTAEHAQSAYRDELEVMRSGRPLIGKVEKETWPDGRVTWVFTTKLPLRDKQGRIVGTMGISRDITERKMAEEKLEQANIELAKNKEELLRAFSDLRKSHEELKSAQLQLIQAEKMQSVGRLAAGVAHEVKNPLAVLGMGITYLQHALEQNPDENIRLVLSDMKNAIERADTIIRGLLDFSVPKELSLQEEPMSLIVDQALALVRHDLAQAKVRIHKEYPADLPRVRVDKGKIEQVLVNVFLNAIHAMPEGGDIHIRLSTRVLGAGETAHDAGDRSGRRFRDGTRVLEVEILDTGTGISTDKLSKIFDPFFTTKPTGKGTGLGLTVTRKIIELHEGAIEIKNRSDGVAGAQVSLMFKL